MTSLILYYYVMRYILALLLYDKVLKFQLVKANHFYRRNKNSFTRLKKENPEK